MSYLNGRYEIRLTQSLKKEMNKVVSKNPETYFNKAHFIRIAIIRELRRSKED